MSKNKSQKKMDSDRLAAICGFGLVAVFWSMAFNRIVEAIMIEFTGGVYSIELLPGIRFHPGAYYYLWPNPVIGVS